MQCLEIYLKSELRVLKYRYLTNIKLCKTYKAAYEKTELEYKKTFSKRRYSSYDSFRQIRSRKMKKKEA